MHYQSDLLLNLGVLAAIFLSQGIWLQADGYFTIAVGVYLIFGAGQIIYQSVYQLMDHELSEEEQIQIKNIILAHEHALGLHDLRTRQSGVHRFIQFHLELEDNLSLLEAHSIGMILKLKFAKLLRHAKFLFIMIRLLLCLKNLKQN